VSQKIRTKTKNQSPFEVISHSDVLKNEKENTLLVLKNCGITKIPLKHKTKNQKVFGDYIDENVITIANGPAGTGKTYIALVYALSELLNHNNLISKIKISKPVLTLPGEDMGFIPGELKDKFTPVAESFLLNLYKIIGYNNTKVLIENRIIEFQPLTYIRGINNDNSVVIIDECQNITLSNMRTMLTRIGDHCKYILMGDTNQVDLRNEKLSSLYQIIEILDDIKSIGIMHFTNDDIVRNELIKLIEIKFNNYLKK